MPKYKFMPFYGKPELPDELIVEAKDEDQAWELFDKQVLEPITDSYICEEGEG